ncbi:PIG-X / PBN1 domain-containing protein [Hirsutella rhossiliensis]|uniref:Protein PBN1 n=1 Tax=Hirsutella rhossiliensis TaxID=111463 RepID=A0A9P8SI69_9HYPO|nr:PIG-X / PBN1 domain-containing protein [Hirsutella rhossiliensis]KAH0963571.1 PIG-X / PBN1 domain-containing protein [Hirsutella rhossiliensis]
MRERVTFVHPQDTDVDPEALDVQPAGLVGPSTDSVRQDRLTFNLDELPLELANLLRGHDAVHLRWTSPRKYDTLEPFSSRQSPGLHVLYTPTAPGANNCSKLCEFLQKIGPVDCMAPEAFTAADTRQHGLPGSMFFYQELEDLSTFIASGLQDICPELDPICLSRLRSLITAASLDLSFDSADQALKIAAFWPLRVHSLTVPGSSMRRTEVGIFTKGSPPNLGPHEVGLGGVLSVLGEQTAPSPVLFAASSRHRLSDMSFSSEFLMPAGLHPTLQLKLSTNKPPVQDSECAPYAYLTLPRKIFADRYQFEDRLFLASKNLTASRYTTLPVDLEAPEYTTKTWGSNVLVELAPPLPSKKQAWTVQLPLHIRYLKPTVSGYAQVEVPYPAVFWACESGSEGDFSTNPFDRRHLGYDELFSSETTFWHAAPKPEVGNRIMSSISVPVLKEEGAAWVRLGTTAVVGLGCAWVIWKLLAAWIGSTQQGGKDEREKSRQKKAN